MNIKIESIINSVEVLKKITNAEIPIQTSYYIAKNIEKIEKELEFFEKERTKIVKKYGEKKEDGELIVSENGNVNIVDVENFNKEMQELNSLEVELDIVKINIEDLRDSKISITPREVLSISYLL